jgi:hypothetical protein
MKRRFATVTTSIVVVVIFVSSCGKENGLSTHHHTFGTAINCMDGRTQEAAMAYLRENHGVDHVDAITEPGPCRILADNTDEAVIANIKKRVGISVHKHHSRVIAVIAHPECAGNPVDKEEQLGHLRMAYATVEGFGFTGVEIILLWVNNDFKTVERIPAPALQVQ